MRRQTAGSSGWAWLPDAGAHARYRVLGLCLLLLTAILCGCASPSALRTAGPRPFDFQKDTFAYANELLWIYHYNTNGNWWTESRVPKPDYTLHCFVVARSAIQFFENARFHPELPAADENTYRHLIRKLASTSLRKPLPESKLIVIPGYACLREFSKAWEPLLKEECGSAWQSYFQRGHWRMIFPFRRAQQEHVAEHLLESLGRNQPAVVHVATFPRLTINHALVVFGVEESGKELRFRVYDPNEPSAPEILTFDRRKRTFSFPPNQYFLGGRVNVYRVYHAWNY